MVGFTYHLCEDEEKANSGRHQNSELTRRFHEHMVEEGHSYGTREEYEFRFALFRGTDAWITEQNSQQGSFVLEHNMFSTMTEAEIERMRGLDLPATKDGELPPDYAQLDESNLASHVDWRDEGAVNPIKKQGRCGSCWAFSSVAVIEAAHKIKSGELLSLSEQQLVACSDPDNWGCDGASPTRAFNYAHRHGMATETDYPYISHSGKVKVDCDRPKEAKGVVQVDKYQYVQPQSAAQLKAAISKGVVVTCVDADRTFRQYKSGILDSAKCGTNLNHGIAAVGYGTENGKDYYIVRNSWGTRWGDAGYGKIAAVEGTKGICGIQ